MLATFWVLDVKDDTAVGLIAFAFSIAGVFAVKLGLIVKRLCERRNLMNNNIRWDWTTRIRFRR